jgi:hypothetical protein
MYIYINMLHMFFKAFFSNFMDHLVPGWISWCLDGSPGAWMDHLVPGWITWCLDGSPGARMDLLVPMEIYYRKMELWYCKNGTLVLDHLVPGWISWCQWKYITVKWNFGTVKMELWYWMDHLVPGWISWCK